MNDQNENSLPAINAQQNEMQIISATDNPIQAIAKMAASGVGTEVIEQMKGLVEWDDARRARAAFNAAFSAAKKEFKEAKKSGFNSHIERKYSLLEDYDEATRKALSKHGLSWRHIPATIEGNITSITCVLAHESGHYETAEMRAPSYSMMNKMVNELQSVGIVTMYLKRLTLCSMLGLVSDSEFDNDGNGGNPGQAQTQKTPPSQPQRKSDKSENRSKPPARTGPSQGGSLQENHIRLIKAKIEASGSLGEQDLFMAFDVKDYSGIAASRVNEVLDWIKSNG